MQQALSEQKGAYTELQAEVKRQKTSVRALERESASVTLLKDSAGESQSSH